MPTALVSAYDKTDLPAFCQALVDLGWDLISSGGTYRLLTDHGIPAVSTEDYTGYPAMLGHRVATLHPRLHGGILAVIYDPKHQADMAKYDIRPIDMVVGGLYPFWSDPSIELIDVGGPTLVRGGAKNHERVIVLVDPGDYDLVLSALRDHDGVPLAMRRALARKAFAHTAEYDASIVTWFDQVDGTALPDSIHLTLRRFGTELQYGENGWQIPAGLYLDPSAINDPLGFHRFVMVAGNPGFNVAVEAW